MPVCVAQIVRKGTARDATARHDGSLVSVACHRAPLAATAGLEEITALLASNPILAVPNVGEPTLLYIAATHQVVSAVLVVRREEDGHKFPVQKPEYYVSIVITPCKSQYPHYQKIAYAVFMASRKLRH